MHVSGHIIGVWWPLVQLMTCSSSLYWRTLHCFPLSSAFSLTVHHAHCLPHSFTPSNQPGMLANLVNLSFLALALPITSLANHVPLVNRHHDLAKRADGHVEVYKRFDNVKWSWYYTETGNQWVSSLFQISLSSSAIYFTEDPAAPSSKITNM